MIEALKKIWDFSADEKSNLNKSLWISIFHACFYVLQIGAVYFVLQGIANGEKHIKTALIALFILLVSILGRALTNYHSQLRQTHAGYFMVANARIRITNRLKKIPMGLLNDSKMANILGILTTGLSETENSVPSILITMLTGFLSATVFTIMVLVFDVRVGLVVVIGTLAYLLLSAKMQRVSARLAPRRSKAQVDLSDKIVEHIQGMPVIKSFNLTGKGDEKTRKAIDESRSANLKIEQTFTPYTIGTSLIIDVASVVIMYLAIMFYIDGTMTLPDSLMTLLMSYMVFSQIQQAGSSMSELRIVSNSIDKVKDIENIPVMQMEQHIKIASNKKQDIEIKNINFSYEKKPVLKELSLTIPEKTTVAFIGPSGAGKTTLAKLIARFWDVDSGEIKIGGKNIKEYTLEDLMEQISIVFQSVYLFEDTIENNIRFGKKDASEEEIISAAKKAACHDFIMNLPEGYQTKIGEGGASLSGGEKQRISIARAIIKDAPIIIFDEATANVDPENEDKLQKAINALMEEKTVIMIAHRLKTVKNADQIVVINHGQIVQKGKHEELIQEQGIYSDFINIREKTENWKIS
ncbi:MAG: ABC transporter ATP-binding protein [Peptococcales bacterium]|jgi:ATP-binding cassette subfamily B protein IrtB